MNHDEHSSSDSVSSGERQDIMPPAHYEIDLLTFQKKINFSYLTTKYYDKAQLNGLEENLNERFRENGRSFRDLEKDSIMLFPFYSTDRDLLSNAERNPHLPPIKPSEEPTIIYRHAFLNIKPDNDPFISTTEDLGKLLNAVSLPGGDQNLRNDVFRNAQRIGVFPVPKEFSRRMKDENRYFHWGATNNNPKEEEEVLFRSRQDNDENVSLINYRMFSVTNTLATRTTFQRLLKKCCDCRCRIF